MLRSRPLPFLLPLLAMLAACPSQKPPPVREAAKTHVGSLVELPPEAFPSFADDLTDPNLVAALDHSITWCDRVLKHAPGRTTWFGDESVPLERVRRSLVRFRELVTSATSSAEVAAAIRTEFRVFRSTGNSDGDVLFTGYYLPELRGALARDARHTVPLYRAPDDIVIARAKDFPQLKADLVGRVQGNRFVPYPTRSEIANGALSNRALELLWVDDPVDAFFLEIQGSGVVRLPDGSRKVVTYAGKNGHAYYAIGKAIVEKGGATPETLSMQVIRAWLEANPAERDAVLHRNASYVFFRLADDAIGSINVPVTAGRTIATDTKVFPKGALAFIDTPRPDAVDPTTDVPLRRFVLDQDTGGAIRTAARVDVFWGSGEEAAAIAGRMKHFGQLYYLLLRE